MKEEIKSKSELQELNCALQNAVKASLMLIESEDGGTCNMDSVTIKIKIPAKFLAEASVGLSKMLVSDYGKMWRGYYMVKVPLSGQANRRSRMAETACKVLQDAGYNAFMYSQCD